MKHITQILIAAMGLTLGWSLPNTWRLHEENARLRNENVQLGKDVMEQKREALKWKIEYGAIKAVHWDCTRK